VTSPAVWGVAALILLLNLPFGFWRAGTRKFTLPWFLAVHVPVPIAIGLRIAIGMGWRLAALPVFVAAFFTGQFLGGRLRLATHHAGGDPGTGNRHG